MFINELWENYQEKKRTVSRTIKQREVEHKIKTIINNAYKKTSNSRAYWRTLKSMNKRNNTPLQLKDPDDPSKIISDPKEIKKILTSYWKNLSQKPITNNETLTDTIESYLHDQHDDTDMFNNI